jgi:hypothetical protein
MFVYKFVRPHGTISVPTGRIFTKIDNWIFFLICREKSGLIKIWQNKGTLHEDRYIFMKTSLSFLLRIGNVSKKKDVEKLKIHILRSIYIFLILPLWRNVEKYLKRQTCHRWQYSTAHAHPVPCCRFAACKRTLKVALTRYFQAKFNGHFSPNSSTFHC